MSQWNQPFILDEEAYQERFAIMLEALEVEQPNPEKWRVDAVRDAAVESGYRTPWAIAATAAARGDWEPAKELCRRERDRHGEEWARGAMRSIQEAVRAKVGAE